MTSAASGGDPLDQAFFAQPVLTVARALVGAVLEATGTGGVRRVRIVETEAYGGTDDPASHAGRGPTPRSAIMFGPAGFAYVYVIYGMHHCLNLVTCAEGEAGAVLIRALEPMTGREIMARRRGLDPDACRDRDLTAGPGRLCRALGIDLRWNGTVLGDSAPGIVVEPCPELAPRIAATPRIGIRQAVDRPYRFVAVGSPCLTV